MRLKSAPATAFLILLSCVFTSCSVQPGIESSDHQAALAGIAPGTIRLDVSAEGSPEYYWQYAVEPQVGTVRQTYMKTIPRGRDLEMPESSDQTAGADNSCSDKPSAISPDGRYLGRCEKVFDKTNQFSGVYHDAFVLEDVATGTELFHWRMEPERSIRGFSWSPDSSAVAVLNLRQNYVRFKFLGHLSTSLDSVYVDVISPSSKFVEYTVRANVPDAYARILSWNLP